MLYKGVDDNEPTTKGETMNTKRGNTTYVLKGHEIHTTGKHGYFVGSVMDPANFEMAVDNAEEEMRCLMANAKIEFGVSQ